MNKVEDREFSLVLGEILEILDHHGKRIQKIEAEIEIIVKALRRLRGVKSGSTRVVWVIGTPFPLGAVAPASTQEHFMANAPFTLPDNSQVPVQALFLDPLGNPQSCTNAALAVDNAAIGTLTVTPPADPTAPVTSISGVLAAAGALGTCNVTVTATDPDGNAVTDTQPFSVVSSGATTVKWVIGTPTVKPAAAPATT